MLLDFSKHKILIVGDIMLDKYYFGQVERISPEAPVPIVNIRKEESRPGGASNVANNIASLGGNVILCGCVGHDLFGKELERIIRDRHIETCLLKTDSPTITKARIIGGKQQIVRLDYEDKLVLTPEKEKEAEKAIRDILPGCSILVLSDYGKGFISDNFCRKLIQLAQKAGIPIVIDPKGKEWDKYAGAGIITPNVKELSDIVGYIVPNEDKAIEEAAGKIIREKHLSTLLVTRSEKGMSLVTETQSVHLPTHSQEVFDVSGAGDTVVATLSLCIANGYPVTEAMKIANIAAGIVVKKLGTATLSIEELQEGIKNFGS